MGKCRFCGEKAKLFTYEHPRCRQKYDNGRKAITAITSSILNSQEDPYVIAQKLKKRAKESFVPDWEFKQLIEKSLDKLVTSLSPNCPITLKEESTIFGFMKDLKLDHSSCSAFTMLLKRSIIQSLLEDKSRTEITFLNAPFNMQKSEKIIYIFDEVKYFEHKATTHRISSTYRLSVKLTKGVTVRSSFHSSSPTTHFETNQIDAGALGVTTKNLYFYGIHKRFRINFKKILSYSPCADGIEIQRDALTAPLQIFKTYDSQFTSRLLELLIQKQSYS